MILVLHAYSRGNRGDGLLVDLTVKAIKKAIPEETDIVVVAMDAESFNDLYLSVQVPMTSEVRYKRIFSQISTSIKLMFNLVSGRQVSFNNLSKLASKADLIVGVGGGYMRSGSWIEGLKACIVHATQAYISSWAKCPAIYLPQSVGPLNGVTGKIINRAISGINTIYLRDDKSVSELTQHNGVVRAPDLAIMKLFDIEDSQLNAVEYKNVYIIARDLKKSHNTNKQYISMLNKLRLLIPEAEVVLQSAVRGNNDQKFYEKLKWGTQFRSITQAIKDSGPGVVVSVRLHGAIQSLIDGCPSVHLSYERKGFGAYDDIGLQDYVHCATQFDPDLVSKQVFELCSDSSEYWRRISLASTRVKDQHEKMLVSIRDMYKSNTGL
ncbi:MAG: polysaccharide pyruvyl transferase family protein [Candidatus Thiodiazotropha sp. L084R]